MKTKEELLKIYSAYLPYELKMRCIGIFQNEETFTLSVNNKNDPEREKCTLDWVLDDVDKDYFKPILYSMDMLTKEIEHKGERFIPIEKIQEIFELPEDKCFLLRDVVNSLSDFFFTKDLTDIFRFNTVIDIYNKLLEWHLNVFNLDESEYIKKESL